MSWIIWRGKPKKEIAHLAYYLKSGKIKTKSLKTTKVEEANLKKADFDLKHNAGLNNVISERIRYDTTKAEWLSEFNGPHVTSDDHSTYGIYKQALVAFERFFSPVYLSEVTDDVAKKWLKFRQQEFKPGTKEVYSKSSVNIDLRAIKAFFGWAKKKNYIAVNPFRDIKPIDIDEVLPKFLTSAQVQKVLALAKNSDNRDAYLMVLFFLYTGIRMAALIRLKWENFDLNAGVMLMKRDRYWRPKGRKEQALPLHGELLAELKKRVSEQEVIQFPLKGYIFPGNQDGHRGRSGIEDILKGLYTDAGLTFGGAHLLRHTLATHFKGPLKVLQELYGHSDIKTTMGYVHITEEQRRAIMELDYGNQRNSASST